MYIIGVGVSAMNIGEGQVRKEGENERKMYTHIASSVSATEFLASAASILSGARGEERGDGRVRTICFC